MTEGTKRAALTVAQVAARAPACYAAQTRWQAAMRLSTLIAVQNEGGRIDLSVLVLATQNGDPGTIVQRARDQQACNPRARVAWS